MGALLEIMMFKWSHVKLPSFALKCSLANFHVSRLILLQIPFTTYICICIILSKMVEYYPYEWSEVVLEGFFIFKHAFREVIF